MGLAIFPQQLEAIRSLRIQRVSQLPNSILGKLDESYFYNTINDNVAQTLRNEASEEDLHNTKAYYVILDQDNDVLFYFSLKTGLLYDKYIDVRNWKNLNKLIQDLDLISKEKDYTPEELAIVNEIREKMRSMKGLTKADIERIPKKGNTVFEDIEKEFNEHVTHVGATYSGIELVHFCSNENLSTKIQSLNLGHKIGVVVFWTFVVDIVLKVMKHIGCEYLFLFAADSSADEDLIHYYSSQLQFKNQQDVSTAKPIYDFTCRFMYQPLSDLECRRKLFFDNYNLSPDEV